MAGETAPERIECICGRVALPKNWANHLLGVGEHRQVGPVKCSICGDTEPVHVHADGERVEDYFTVGRGETEMDAALRWKGRALQSQSAAHREGWDAALGVVRAEVEGLERWRTAFDGSSGWLTIGPDGGVIDRAETLAVLDRLAEGPK